MTYRSLPLEIFSCVWYICFLSELEMKKIQGYQTLILQSNYNGFIFPYKKIQKGLSLQFLSMKTVGIYIRYP